MNATLYKIVFLVMTAASSDANRNSKFFSPIQSLAKTPLGKIHLFERDDHSEHWDIVVYDQIDRPRQHHQVQRKPFLDLLAPASLFTAALAFFSISHLSVIHNSFDF